MPRPILRIHRLEDRLCPVADFAVGLGGAPLGDGKAIAADQAGNTVFAGLAYPEKDDRPDPAVVVAKFGPEGDAAWARAFASDAGWAVVRGVAVDPGNNVYVTGLYSGTADFDPGDAIANLTAPPIQADGDPEALVDSVNSFVVKLDPGGIFLWAKSLGAGGTVEASSVAADSAGNVYIAGQFMGRPDLDPGEGSTVLESLGDPDAFVARLSADGTLAWAKRFGGAEYSIAHDVTVAADGSAYVGGSFTGDVQFDDDTRATATGYLGAYLVRLDADGNVIWARPFGGSGTADLSAVARDESGAVYAVGTLTGDADLDPGPGDATVAAGEDTSAAFVLKLGDDGEFRWARGFGGAPGAAVQTADVTAGEDDVTVTGTFWGSADFDPGPGAFNLTSADLGDVFLTHLGADGEFAGAEAFGGPGEDHGEDVLQVDDQLVLAGSFEGEIQFDTRDGAHALDAGEFPDAFLFQTAAPVASPANQPPAVNVDGTFAITEGEDLSLGLSASDRENDRLSVAWDVNGDGDFTDATGPAAVVSWDRLRRLGITDSTPGRPMSVRVSDGVSSPVDVRVSLLIENAAPRAVFRGGPAVREGANGWVSFAGETDHSLADRAAGFRFSYDFNDDGKWDLGDGQTFGGAATAAGVMVPAAFLLDSGPHTVRARIFDKDGGFAEYAAIVTVLDVAPTGRFAADGWVTEGRPGLVRFTDLIDPSPADRR
ncbi:MAG TPA: SBBP repeat-containing protein, partial [Gemmataceae bacterium]|nr:SBBP repeat-containing protein [Gemmataceae bacterium]